MNFWPENFIPSLQSNTGLAIAAAVFGVAVAIILKWNKLRELWHRAPDDEG